MSAASQWADAVAAKLFNPDLSRLRTWIDRLVKLNQEEMGEDLAGFLFNGQWYRHSSLGKGKYVKKPLAYGLTAEMESYLEDEKIILMDKKLIHQAVYLRVMNCMTLQDVRDALPDCLTELFPELARLERIRNEQFFVNNLSDLRQWSKILPKIEQYSVARLMF